MKQKEEDNENNQSLSVFEFLLELIEFQAYRLQELFHIQPNLLLQLLGKLFVIAKLHIHLLHCTKCIHINMLTSFPLIILRNKMLLPQDHQVRQMRTQECRDSP